MAAEPLVVVVVLNWNGWANTLKCLASLYALAAPAPEILLVDNHSTDDSVARIRDVYPRLDIQVSSRNLGFGGGCNLGIRAALERSADYIWLINSDAVADPDALNALVRLAEETPSLAAVGSLVYDLGSHQRLQLWGGGHISPWLARSRPLRGPGALSFVSGASMLLRATALHTVGLFDEQTYFMYWEDTDLSFRLRQHGWELSTAEASHVWHRGSDSLWRGNPTIDEYYVRSAVRFFHRHVSCPRWATLGLMTSMLAKRIALGRWHRVRAVLRGWRAA